MTNDIKHNDKVIKREYNNLIGKTIKQVRALTEYECNAMGWSPFHGHSVPFIIVLDDYTTIIPTSDPEGNDAGHLFVEYTFS